MTPMEYLEHFKQNWDTPSSARIFHTRENWNARAPQWEDELHNDEATISVTRHRIDNAVRFLKSISALEPDFRVIDIGCGPGRFVEEFAKHTRLAEGTDFSDAMLEYAKSFCQTQGRDNVAFTQCDFLQDDISQFHWEGAFDLVYASMTPALRSYASLEKMIAMSRAFCCSSNCILQQSSVQNIIAEAVGPERVHPMWDGRSFFDLWNLVWSLGYFPWTDYYTLKFTHSMKFTERDVEMTLCRMLSRDELQADDLEKAWSALCAKAPDGVIQNDCTCWYGAVAWDVRRKTPRW